MDARELRCPLNAAVVWMFAYSLGAAEVAVGIVVGGDDEMKRGARAPPSNRSPIDLAACGLLTSRGRDAH